MLRAVQLVVVLLASTGHASAGVLIPVKVETSVLLDTVTTAWGWELLYRGEYGEAFDISDVFFGAGDYVMLAAVIRAPLPNGVPAVTTLIEVLAAARTADVLTYTPLDTTHTANGVQWYFNEHSMGFAGSGDVIQNPADVGAPDALDRLSWITSGSLGFPEFVEPGGRAGAFHWPLGPEVGTVWERLIFTANAPVIPIPEPSSLAIFGIAAAVIVTGLARRRCRRGGSELRRPERA